MAEILRRHVALGAGAGDDAVSIAELYHENTKLYRSAAIAAPADEAGLPRYGVQELEAMARAYKRYRHHPQVPLPPATRPCTAAFETVVTQRRTERSFAVSEPVALEDLATLLRWTYGVSGAIPMRGGGLQPLRAAPSAGALYPAEIYLGVRLVDGLEPGLYHFEVPAESLARLEHGDPSERIASVCCGQPHAREAALVVLVSAVTMRTRRKYGERGYRYALLDIGHLGQNLCLAGAALDLAVVTTCGFFDDEGADLLGIDGIDEALMYVAFVGRIDRRTA